MPHLSLGQSLAWWRRWRHRRPFWAGVFTLAGGLTIVLLPANQFTVLMLPGVAGLAGFLLGGLITAIGPLQWFLPDQHILLGITTVLLALAAFIYTNLGGFLLGTLLSIIGGCLSFAWTPDPTPPQTPPRPRPSPAPRARG